MGQFVLPTTCLLSSIGTAIVEQAEIHSPTTPTDDCSQDRTSMVARGSRASRALSLEGNDERRRSER
jgi:hypothetical protein